MAKKETSKDILAGLNRSMAKVIEWSEALQNSLDSLTQRVKTSESDIHDLEEDAVLLSTDIETATAGLAALTSRVTDVETRVESVEDNGADAERSIESIRRKLND